MFCISFVVVTVKARVASLDPALEEAGRDLYGSPNAVFWRITFPLLLPGILSAALLSFSLSFDDFIVTNFNSGNLVTFPMFVFGANQRGVPPQINVIGSIVFFLALFLVLAAQYRTRFKFRRSVNA
jgi:spermidine/putrescine transport system permease protein